MKAYRKETEVVFVPVVLELESQEEVDVLYTICNHTTLTDLFKTLNTFRHALDGFDSMEKERYWQELNEGLKIKEKSS